MAHIKHFSSKKERSIMIVFHTSNTVVEKKG